MRTLTMCSQCKRVSGVYFVTSVERRLYDALSKLVAVYCASATASEEMIRVEACKVLDDIEAERSE